jgi:hypothetical protein
MTGELADCFATRADGVATILDQVTSILPSQMVRVYSVDGTWKHASMAARSPWSVAASNWAALARFLARNLSTGRHLLIDVGSTTTDIIPLEGGEIAISASTDSQRLQCGALVYTGVERSNVAAISRHAPLHGTSCPLMNELFATSQDVHVWLGDIDEDVTNTSTADGKPLTRDAARFRLARIVGEDGSTLSDEDIDELAKQIRTDQVSLIARAMERVCESVSQEESKTSKRKTSNKKTASHVRTTNWPDSLVVCGHGSFLVEDAMNVLGWDCPKTDWANHFHAGLSRCAPAYAVACLASLRQQDDDRFLVPLGS